MRPLGIPSFDDKLIQEMIRMILQAIYEGYFEKSSHGFRPNKSCHTALNAIQKSFTGAKWFIEGDMKGFFDNIVRMVNLRPYIRAFCVQASDRGFISINSL